MLKLRNIQQQLVLTNGDLRLVLFIMERVVFQKRRIIILVMQVVRGILVDSIQLVPTSLLWGILIPRACCHNYQVEPESLAHLPMEL